MVNVTIYSIHGSYGYWIIIILHIFRKMISMFLCEKVSASFPSRESVGLQHRLQPRPATSPTRQLGLFRVRKLTCHLMPRKRGVQKCSQAIFQTGPISTFPKDSSFNTTTRVGSAVADLSNPVETDEHLACFMCVSFFPVVSTCPSYAQLSVFEKFWKRYEFSTWHRSSLGLDGLDAAGQRWLRAQWWARRSGPGGSGWPHLLVQCFWMFFCCGIRLW